MCSMQCRALCSVVNVTTTLTALNERINKRSPLRPCQFPVLKLVSKY